MVRARGVRYLVDPQTRQHVSGNRDWPHDMRLAWILEPQQESSGLAAHLKQYPDQGDPRR